MPSFSNSARIALKLASIISVSSEAQHSKLGVMVTSIGTLDLTRLKAALKLGNVLSQNADLMLILFNFSIEVLQMEVDPRAYLQSYQLNRSLRVVELGRL